MGPTPTRRTNASATSGDPDVASSVRAQLARRTGAAHTWLVSANSVVATLGLIGLASPGMLLVVASDDMRDLYARAASQLGFSVVFCEPTTSSLANATGDYPRECVTWVVPTLGGVDVTVADIRAIGIAARCLGVTLVVDNTLATCGCCAAGRMAAHVVAEMATSGVVAVSMSKDALASLSSLRDNLDEAERCHGPRQRQVASVASWLDSMDDITRKRNDNAAVVAAYLSCHPRVGWVSYPGLPDSPSRSVADRILMWGFGAVVDFCLLDEACDAYCELVSNTGVLGSSFRGNDPRESRLVLLEMRGRNDRGVFRRHLMRYRAGCGDASEDIRQIERAISASAR